METTLHQQLKNLYTTPRSSQEVWVDGYRIDVKRGRQLIEIQTSGLGAIREKIRSLLLSHRVTVVKPLIARKMLLIQDRAGSKIHTRRWSPRRGGWIDLFDELAHFTTVFPHPNLTMEFPLIEIEERRFPRKTRRFWHRAYRIEDQHLLQVLSCRRARTPQDLVQLLEVTLPDQFDTRDLSLIVDAPRRMAQKVAYCWRRAGTIAVAGKNGNSIIYRPAAANAASVFLPVVRVARRNKKGDPKVA